MSDISIKPIIILNVSLLIIDDFTKVLLNYLTFLWSIFNTTLTSQSEVV
jgi:hypothetical protein